MAVGKVLCDYGMSGVGRVVSEGTTEQFRVGELEGGGGAGGGGGGEGRGGGGGGGGWGGGGGVKGWGF